jgi:YHS domain-containing protein/plastocyanin
MKRMTTLLLGAALLATPLAAQEHEKHEHKNHEQHTATISSDWKDAQATWNEVREGAKQLDALIAAKKLDGVHDAALGLRDTVRELRFAWKSLSPEAQAKADGLIRRIDGLLDTLHESADHNDLRGVVKDQRTLHVLLDQIAGAFPNGVLKPVGPVVAKGSVKDPFCRMDVDPSTAAAKAVYNGQTYYFCAKSEAEDFKKNPAPYVALYDELNFGKPKMFTVGLGAGRIEAGQPATLVFAIREQGKSAVVNKFQLVHEKYFHLIMVSDDLSWFAHEHPQMAPDGRFYLKWTFPRVGRYWLYSDFTPAEGSNTVVRSEVRVGGGTAKPMPRMAPDKSLTKNVDGYDFSVKVSPPLQAGRQSLLTYSISKDGQPVSDLQPYLAAMGHMMAIHLNGRDVVHTHAVNPGADPQTGLEVTPKMATEAGPQITYKLQLPSGGVYRIWAQFEHNGRVLTVPFTFDVKPNSHGNNQGDTMKSKTLTALATSALITGAAHAAPARKAPAKTSKAAPQKVMVMLPDGYKTGAATVKAGKPVALTFHLTKDAGCGNSVSVPAAKWTKALKVGEKATVTFTPKKSGPLAFACSMNMMKGTLTVK